jgi:hypothetical protein
MTFSTKRVPYNPTTKNRNFLNMYIHDVNINLIKFSSCRLVFVSMTLCFNMTDRRLEETLRQYRGTIEGRNLYVTNSTIYISRQLLHTIFIEL